MQNLLYGLLSIMIIILFFVSRVRRELGIRLSVPKRNVVFGWKKFKKR